MEYLYKQYNNEPGKAPTGEKYIYVITEIETGKMYIGQTSNFHARMRSHRTCKCNLHSAIDRAIQEKGADAFQYEILELCAADDADSRERYWIEKSDSCNEQKGFNTFKGGQKSFSDENYSMLVEMLQQGMTLKTACDAINTSIASARRELKRRDTNLSEIRYSAAEHKYLRRKSTLGKEINIADIKKLVLDDDVTKKAGIIPFILSDHTWRDEKHLSLRAFTESQKLRAYERQGHKCPLCVANGIYTEYAFEDMEGDHIIPWSKGGHTTDDNLQMLCKKCNSAKSDM